MANLVTELNKYKIRNAIIATILVFLICIVYGQAFNYDFCIYDDYGYIHDNQHRISELSVTNIVWAFTSFTFYNWHPVIWLSYMIDFQLFGLKPAGYHIENIVIHSINTVILLFLFKRITGEFWKSAIVASLFALHPLHVESVVWIAERKDVLSTLFMLLCMHSYVEYSKEHSKAWYIIALLIYAFGLMSKPMLVSLPFLLLLIDYWPLGRTTSKNIFQYKASFPANYNHSLSLIIEKLPFALLALFTSILTLFAQTSSLSSLSASPLSSRIANGLVAYVSYLYKMLHPINLAIIYPFPDSIPGWQQIICLTLLGSVSFAAIKLRSRYPFILSGWLWYLISLFPVIGIVRVGLHSMADRYAYVPLIGIYFALTWSICHLLDNCKKTLAVISILILTTCVLVSWKQVSLWKDNATLFKHAIKVTETNYIAMYMLGTIFETRGENDNALECFYKAVKLRPNSVNAHYNLAMFLHKIGMLDKAVYHYKYCLSLDPYSWDIHNNLGITLAELGELDEAIVQFIEALRIKPDNVETINNLIRAYSIKKEAAIQSN